MNINKKNEVMWQLKALAGDPTYMDAVATAWNQYVEDERGGDNESVIHWMENFEQDFGHMTREQVAKAACGEDFDAYLEFFICNVYNNFITLDGLDCEGTPIDFDEWARHICETCEDYGLEGVRDILDDDHMSVKDLNREQLRQLKTDILTERLTQQEYRTPSYGELAAIDELVTDEETYERYDGYEFVPDDFFTGDDEGGEDGRYKSRKALVNGKEVTMYGAER